MQPYVWRTASSAPIQLEGGARQYIVFYIALSDADAALATLQRYGVRYSGSRVKEHGEVHIDFEDPEHMLACQLRAAAGSAVKQRTGRVACRGCGRSLVRLDELLGTLWHGTCLDQCLGS